MKTKFLSGWFLSALQSANSLALLATSAWLLSRADQKPSIMYLSIAVVGVRAFALGKAFFRYAERLVLHDSTFRKAATKRTAIFASLVDRAPIGLAGAKMGELLKNLVDDTEEELNLDLRFRPALVQSSAVTLLGLICFVWLSPNLAWVFVLTVSAIASITVLCSKSASRTKLELLNQYRSELATLVENLVARNRVLNAYGWAAKSLNSLADLTVKISGLEKQVARSSGLLQSFVVFGTYLSVFTAAVVAIGSGELLPSEQVAVLVLLPLGIFEYLQAIPSAFQNRAKAISSSQRLRKLIQAKMPTELIFGSDEVETQFLNFSVSNASVDFPEGYRVSLPDIDLNRGESVSLLAPSGSGKSTLANVLVGFIRPSSGKFEFNGKPISDYSNESLRKIVGLVEQSPVVLAGTVRDNLLLAKPDAEDRDLIAVLLKLDLWRMLEVRQGLNTLVGGSSMMLSGGEVQRLALARNLLAGHQLVVLDEPTASLGSKQGIKLVKDLIETSRKNGLSTLLITHDLKLASLTDRSVQI